jgi:hypothetical protein
MKKLGWDGTRLHGFGMIDWHNISAQWHVEWGTWSDSLVYFMTWGEDGIRIVPCDNGRTLQAGKKKLGSKARRRRW